VRFDDGDICDQDTQVRYSSEIRYTCKNSSEEAGWPTLLKKEGKTLKFNSQRKMSLHILMGK